MRTAYSHRSVIVSDHKRGREKRETSLIVQKKWRLLVQNYAAISRRFTASFVVGHAVSCSVLNVPLWTSRCSV